MRRKLLLWLMHTGVYRFLLKRVIPYIRFSTYYTSLRGDKYHKGYKVLKPGHIILTNDRKKLTSLLIPGTMSHAALCLSRRDAYDSPEVAEMTHTDYTLSDFFDLCKEADRVVLLRCVDWDAYYTNLVIYACHSLKNAKYDMEFELGVEALYCSELILQADKMADALQSSMDVHNPLNVYGRLNVDLSDLAGIGQKYLSPDGLLFAKNVVCEWDSDNVFTGKTGEEIEKLMERKDDKK